MLSGIKTYTDRWYSGYAFQGASVLGVAPILIPLIVAKLGSNSAAGAVVAAFYLGQLTAPLWGWLTDRLDKFRLIYSLGYLLLAVGMGAFAMVHELAFWLGLAFVQGAGAAATNTVAAMFIVEFKPKEQWDPRIGWLQTFYGTGQALGLGLAAALQMAPLWGMGLAAALMVPGFILGRRGLPRDQDRRKSDTATFQAHALRPPRHAYSQLHRSQGLCVQGIKGMVREWDGPFGLFIFSWLLTMLGTWMVYNLYPLLMKDLYGVDAGMSSLAYAIAATLGIFAYAPSGVLAEKIGDGPVLVVGILMTLVSMVGMTLLAYVHTGDNWLLSQAAFLFMPVAWSPLIVAGTSYTAQLATMPEGNALGVYNSATAVGSVLGALAAGWLSDAWGYGVVMLGASILTIAGLALLAGLLWRQRNAKAAAKPQGASG
ncbi:MAG: MFS transporter [Desulfarculaceae bacterium]|nr:MFS transporter [Desulfarculaceae bacterium]MCF8073565.1 MFS transporter [Desulfarculaceae bacterium]MCF8103087.1 MFS transporter [Desulfarculaceae bacterium]MCF8115719.1 MFS transporter [Desulfarculaceae bacterium]